MSTKRVMLALSGVLILTGCGSTKVVYPTDCVVESKIPIDKPDKTMMQPSQKPWGFTEEQIKKGVDNGTAIGIISKNNKELWQEDRNKVSYLQQYILTLQSKGILPK